MEESNQCLPGFPDGLLSKDQKYIDQKYIHNLGI